jgi:hypothetical protein
MRRLVRAAEFALAGLFLYLGITKLPGHILMASAELFVGTLLLIRASELVSTPAVIVVAAVEVALFKRPPIAAIACVSAHGATSWARIVLEKAPHEAVRHSATDDGARDGARVRRE